MSEESQKLYRENVIFRRSIDCGVNKGLSYEKTLEITCLAFAEIMNAQTEREIDRIMREPPSPMFIPAGSKQWEMLNKVKE